MSYIGKYNTNKRPPIEKSEYSWRIPCSDCGVFLIGIFKSDKKQYRTINRYTIRCLACEKKIQDKVEMLEKDIEDYSSTKVNRVIDSKGKDITDKN